MTSRTAWLGQGAGIMGLMLLTLSLVEAPTTTAKPPEATVQSPPAKVVKRLELNTEFYTRYIDVKGLAIVGSNKVEEQAFHHARQMLLGMCANRPAILKTLRQQGCYGILIAAEEKTTDPPEYSHMPDRMNQRARGFGPGGPGQPFSAGEENLLGHKHDRYLGESIFIHELAHAIDFALRQQDDDFKKQLKQHYQRAMDAGLWEDHYAAENAHEFWAEAVQSYFSANQQNDSVHNHVNTHAELKDYDPATYKFIDKTLKQPSYRWTKHGKHASHPAWQ